MNQIRYMMGSHTGYGCGGIHPEALEEECPPWACGIAWRESGPSQLLLNYGWRGRERGGGSGLVGEARNAHTQTQWCEAKRVVRAVLGEWSCSPVFRFGADVFGDYCWRGKKLESIRQPLSLSLPFSTSMRCDESEYSPVVYHNHSAILSFISAESVF